MPAILAGLISALMAGIANEEQYHQSLYQIFPAMAPVNATPTTEYTFIKPGLGRTPPEQAGYQILALVVTLIIAIVSGLITGKSFFKRIKLIQFLLLTLIYRLRIVTCFEDTIFCNIYRIKFININ